MLPSRSQGGPLLCSNRIPSRLALAIALGAVSASSALAGSEVPASAYQDLHWRLVGPLRGGWATAATGVRGRPDTFYFGAADGGVWKSTDAGRTWKPSFQHEGVASIGALVVAPSDPDVLYAGTGQVTTRWDATCGDGVYRSSDGGLTWEHRGLVESEHIGRLWVDPRDANVLLAAALGHLFGSNAERGVFRSEDGQAPRAGSTAPTTRARTGRASTRTAASPTPTSRP